MIGIVIEKGAQTPKINCVVAMDMFVSKRVNLVILLCLIIASPLLFAKDNSGSQRPLFYFGVIGGFGSTTWRGLVPRLENQNAALAISTPLKVNEGGAVWGIFADYELLPCFALEFNYLRFPDATVHFDEFSLFSFINQGKTHLKTKTDTLTLFGKVMMNLSSSMTRLYSGAGITKLHRRDIVLKQSQLTPTFTVGINHRFHPHVMAEISGQYTTGYGESDLNPTNSYMPFLYAVVAKIAYVI